MTTASKTAGSCYTEPGRHQPGDRVALYPSDQIRYRKRVIGCYLDRHRTPTCRVGKLAFKCHVQTQQELLLGSLVEQHGSRQVLVEGLTDEGRRNYDGIVYGFKATADRLDGLRPEAVALEFVREPHIAHIDRLIVPVRWRC